MKKVRHNGRALDKFGVCYAIDAINPHRNATIVYDAEPYDYWRAELYRYICERCPERLAEFENLEPQPQEQPQPQEATEPQTNHTATTNGDRVESFRVYAEQLATRRDTVPTASEQVWRIIDRQTGETLTDTIPWQGCPLASIDYRGAVIALALPIADLVAYLSHALTAIDNALDLSALAVEYRRRRHTLPTSLHHIGGLADLLGEVVPAVAYLSEKSRNLSADLVTDAVTACRRASWHGCAWLAVLCDGRTVVRRDGVADWSSIAEEEGESVCNLYRCYKVGDAFHAYEVQTIY